MSAIISVDRARAAHFVRYVVDRARGLVNLFEIILAIGANRFVAAIARHKSAMLAGAMFLGGMLCVAGIISWILGQGGAVTKELEGAAGYLAVAGFVLGLPALGYAMVTDRAVDELGAREREKLVNHIKRVLEEPASVLRNQHVFLQFFKPDSSGSRLLPVYDPDEYGPKRGWFVTANRPTVLAWRNKKIEFAQGKTLEKRERPNRPLSLAELQLYTKVTGVAAVPVTDASNQVYGVLTMGTTLKAPNMNHPKVIRCLLAIAEELRQSLATTVVFPDIATPDEAKRPQSGSIDITPEVLQSLPSGNPTEQARSIANVASSTPPTT